MTELEPRLSEADAQKVLARATELQAQRDGTLSVAQLREIATELSIPASAVDEALLEFRGAGSANQVQQAAQTSAARRRNPSPLLLAMAAVGSAFAFLVAISVAMRLFP